MRTRSLLHAVTWLVLATLAVGSGCRSRDPEPGDKRGSLTVGGRERTYLYRVPVTLDPLARPWPLVVALHGRLGDGVGMEKLTRLSAVADREGFIVVYPDGVERSWNDGRPGSPAFEQDVDDVAFVSALVDQFVADHGADPSRVFVTGMSNGAMMSHRLACELSSKVAAIAPVTGLLSVALSTTCAPSRAVPTLHVYGTADPLMPYAGGSVASDTGGEVLSADLTRKRWAELDGCTDVPLVTSEPDGDPSDGTSVERTSQLACRDGAEVVLYTITQGGHTWPGGWQYLPEAVIGPTCRDLDASAIIWAFFARHARP